MGTKRTRKVAGWLILAGLIVLAGYGWRYLGRSQPPRYVTVPVERGSIVRSVTATGTVNPVTVVQVGTYVSGPIKAIYADFNTPVKAGQLLAKIDPRPFAAQVALTQASLANSQAQMQKDQANLAYQKITYQRDLELVKSAVIAKEQLDSQWSVYHQAVAQLALDRAAVQQQTAALKAADLNLNYTNIVSPVAGTVVSRNVDQGQTVAASYQTPTLFLVAQDLTKMQVDSNVSESDIGGVHVGQPVDFTVDAYSGKEFKGDVAQVRQAPITVQNVVTYDVVVDVANPELLLMPGMTANVTIVTDRRDNVLRVPLRALSFSPDRGPAGVGAAPRRRPGDRVWVDEGGKLKSVAITRGLDDGNYVEVVAGDLEPGEPVVTDVVKPQNASQPSFHMHFGHI